MRHLVFLFLLFVGCSPITYEKAEFKADSAFEAFIRNNHIEALVFLPKEEIDVANARFSFLRSVKDCPNSYIIVVIDDRGISHTSFVDEDGVILEKRAKYYSSSRERTGI